MKKILALLLVLSTPVFATEIPEGFLDGDYEFRSIGPYRG